MHHYLEIIIVFLQFKQSHNAVVLLTECLLDAEIIPDSYLLDMASNLPLL